MKKIIIVIFVFLNFNILSQNTVWKSISIGGIGHVIGIKEDGTLWGWGSNWHGELGLGKKSKEYYPTQINQENNWKSCSAGWNHTIVLTESGTIWASGNNDYGQLGIGDFIERFNYVQIESGTNWKFISSKYYHTLAIKDDGTLWAWGRNDLGQIGDGTTVNKNFPVQIGKENKWKYVAVGDKHSLAIADDGTLWSWGGNGYTQLGNNYKGNPITIPQQIDNSKNWVYVVCGMNHSIALKKDGSIWAFGDNVSGKCGVGSHDLFVPIPTKVLDNIQSYVFVNVGNHHTYGIKEDGSLWGFGANIGGELGDNSNLLSPTKMGNDTDWLLVAGGQHITIAIKKDGSLWAWGSDYGSGSLFGLGEKPDHSSRKPIQINP